ncbi:SURF1 family protein [Imbroritus primus]|uniref:SURF1 family protein n=1 Tax=Imbroritus primus TaxID=3058603 RepID=UPI003D16130D
MTSRSTSHFTSLSRWFAPVPTLAALTVTIAACLLGNWQLNRGQEKRARAAQLERLAQAEPLTVNQAELSLERVLYHRVKVRGAFEPDKTILLDNRPHAGAARAENRAGFHVLTPLRITGGSGAGRYVLVNRGWLPRDAQDRTRIAPFDTPTGEQELSGVAVASAGHVFALGDANEAGRKIRQNVEVDALAREWHVTLQPFVIQQSGGPQDGLARDWPAPDSGAERHDGYAFQWFALAALTVAFWGVAGYRRGRPNEAQVRQDPQEGTPD